MLDNFFELGGHSLLGARLLTRIERAFGAKLPMESFFLAPTPARMMALLRRESGADTTSRVIPLRLASPQSQ